MTPELKQVLNTIDEFLMKDNAESEKLWQIMTALRGPDSNKQEEKRATTQVVRRFAFPKTFYRNSSMGWSNVGAYYSNDSPYAVEYRTLSDFDSSHFKGHSRYAFDALEMDWDKVNHIKE